MNENINLVERAVKNHIPRAIAENLNEVNVLINNYSICFLTLFPLFVQRLDCYLSFTPNG